MSEGLLALAVIAAFCVVFPLFWCGIVFLISRVSGWTQFAQQYPENAPASGDVFSMCSARLRFFSSYSHCLVVTVSDAGIHIRTILFFKFGHAPIFIPWQAVLGLQRSNVLFFPSVLLAITDKNGEGPVRITLYGGAMSDRIQQIWDRVR